MRRAALPLTGTVIGAVHPISAPSALAISGCTASGLLSRVTSTSAGSAAAPICGPGRETGTTTGCLPGL